MKYHLCCNQNKNRWEVRDENENVLYSGQRFECEVFKDILESERRTNYMICDICEKMLNPLDAHIGRLKGKLITAHIDCWNKEWGV